MNIKTNLLEDYVNFVDLTKNQSKYFRKIIILIVVILCLFLFFVFLNLIQSSIYTNIRIIIILFVYE